MRSVALCVAAGDARAVTHRDRTGGQLCETLILSVGTQFLCKDTCKYDKSVLGVCKANPLEKGFLFSFCFFNFWFFETVFFR